MNQRTKFLMNADWFILFLYGFLTVLFFKDRTTFLDNAFQIFLLTQEGELILNANRWPAMFVQLLPLAGVKLGLGLKSILFLFSASYFLFHALIFVVIRTFLKDRQNAWLLLALLTLPVAHSFFWCNSELILGLSALVLWITFYENKNRMGSLSVAMILPWFHPLLICCFLFVTVYYFFVKGQRRSGLDLLFFIISAATKSQFFSSWYDTNKKANFLSKLEAYQVSDLTNVFSFFNIQNAPVFLCLILALSLCLYKRKFLSFVLLVSFTLLYLFISDVSTTRYHFQFYLEVNFLSLFFVSAFVIKEELKNFEIPKWTNLFFIGLICLCLLRIAFTSKIYKDRQAKILTLSETADRTIVKYHEEEHKWMLEYWASPYESLILSTLDGNSRTFIFHLDPKTFLQSKKEDHLITYFKDYHYNSLNKENFNLSFKRYKLN